MGAVAREMQKKVEGNEREFIIYTTIDHASNFDILSIAQHTIQCLLASSFFVHLLRSLFEAF